MGMLKFDHKGTHYKISANEVNWYTPAEHVGFADIAFLFVNEQGRNWGEDKYVSWHPLTRHPYDHCKSRGIPIVKLETSMNLEDYFDDKKLLKASTYNPIKRLRLIDHLFHARYGSPFSEIPEWAAETFAEYSRIPGSHEEEQNKEFALRIVAATARLAERLERPLTAAIVIPTRGAALIKHIKEL
jgi:hypothetical protein